ncbi:hypothetical protein [Limnobacter sp.]|uniref:spike base protein, RCAP_Rcc01079 family n=1 Tax=Limnobacter sp. TaxID=2003368 RepID=UPI0025C60BCE|nr:hypothetical protein [Limnobacter sp.]
MAYQKLQAGRALAVIKNNSINIPNVGGPTVSGTTDGTTANKLVDSGAAFTSHLVGYIVYNTSDDTVARVTAVDSATQLTLSADIMATGENYTLYADDNPGCVLYAGSGGNIRVLTTGNDDVTFVGVAPGAFIPVQVKRVFASGTGPSDIVALW